MRRFVTERSWTVDVKALPRFRRLGYHLSRIGYGTYRGVVDKRLTFQAAALTYYSVLSIVPLLAFAFSVLKGFGIYHRLVEGTLRPYLQSTFGGNPKLLSALDQVLHFVEQTNVSGLGVFGALLLLYTGIGLLTTIERALNQIWGAKSPRRFVRRVTDYTTMLVVTPLLAFTAVTLAAGARSSSVLGFMRESLSLGPVIDLLLKLTSLFLGCAAMISLYLLMPNARKRLRSVVFGGVVGGVLWQLVLVLYVKLQSGAAGYNALYASFAAFPIFLVWLYAAWMSVLVGAQAGAVHQHEDRLKYELLPGHLDYALEETLAVAVAAEVTKQFVDGEPPLSDEALAERLGVDGMTLEPALNALLAARLVLRVVSDHERIGYTPGREPAQIHVSDVRDAVRRDPRVSELRQSIEAALDPRIGEVLRDEEESFRRARSNVSLRDLAGTLGGRRPASSEA